MVYLTPKMLQRCSKDAPKMLQRCYKNAKKMLQRCSKGKAAVKYKLSDPKDMTAYALTAALQRQRSGYAGGGMLQRLDPKNNPSTGLASAERKKKLQRSSKDALKMLQRYYKMKPEGFLPIKAKTLQRHYKDTTKTLQRYYTKTLQRHSRDTLENDPRWGLGCPQKRFCV